MADVPEWRQRKSELNTRLLAEVTEAAGTGSFPQGTNVSHIYTNGFDSVARALRGGQDGEVKRAVSLLETYASLLKRFPQYREGETRRPRTHGFFQDADGMNALDYIEESEKRLDQ